jgi:hypothetical protein
LLRANAFERRISADSIGHLHDALDRFIPALAHDVGCANARGKSCFRETLGI